MARYRARKKTTPPPTGEHHSQATFFRMIAATGHPAAKLTFAIPNGALNTSAKRIYFAQEGTRAGVPDVLVCWPRIDATGTYAAGLFLEFKYGKNAPTEQQWAWLKALEAVGYCCGVPYSADEGFEMFCRYVGLETKGK